MNGHDALVISFLFCFQSYAKEETIMMHELEGLSWLPYLETQNTNYNHFSFEEMKDKPKKWLASLPMFEYAHVLTVITTLRCGGNPEKYINDLYIKRMNPVLKEYYDRLAHYRLMRSLYMRKYNPTIPMLKESSLTEEVKKMKCFACKTRGKLRALCKQFEEEIYGPRSTKRGI